MFTSVLCSLLFSLYHLNLRNQGALTLFSTDIDRRLHQIHSSVDDHNNQMKELQAHSTHLDQDIQVISQRQRAAVIQQQEEALRNLRHELHNRRHQGEELSATMLETERELQAMEGILQV